MKKWLEKAMKMPGPVPESVSGFEAAEYFVQRGLWACLKGFLNRWRFKACGRRPLIGRGAQIFFPAHITLGNEVVIGPYCVINGLSSEGVRFGDRVHVREYTWIQATSQMQDPGKGLEIGENTYIGPSCYIGAGGGISIGKNVLMGACVHLLAENHQFENPAKNIREQGVSRKGIRIGDDVWIGNQSIILDGIQVGNGSVIAAGSVVTHDVAPFTVVAGNPARVLRERK